MGMKTVYTSTITVPVYASWKCKKCNKCNSSEGVISYQSQASSSSLRSSKQQEARERARYNAESEWQNTALGIILNPLRNYYDLRKHLYLNNTRCPTCHFKPVWTRGIWPERNIGSYLLLLFFAGLFFLDYVRNGTAFLFFNLIALLYPVIQKKLSLKTLENNPDLLPIIGTFNPKLILGAIYLNKSIPSPEEARQMVNKSISASFEVQKKTKKSILAPSEMQKKEQESILPPSEAQKKEQESIADPTQQESIQKKKDDTQKATEPAKYYYSAADEIEKFKNLLDKGIITQEEFEAKKKQLLGL